MKALFILSILVMSCHVQADWLKQNQDIMGTRISVELWHDDPNLRESCSNRIFAEMRRIDALMSPYKSTSEISYINHNAAVSSINISEEMASLINRSLQFSVLSNGAFDITFASVGYRYDYRKQQLPADEFINSTLEAIDYRHIVLTDGRIYFKDSNVRIDLGGIAKGYAVDRAIDIVISCGIDEAMISAGGDSRILGNKRGKPWIIGIQHPRKADDLAMVLPLSDTAISTSGDYQRYFIHKGQRIHHIINPETGRSANQIWSATVTGRDALTTDALSTTIFVLGAEKGLALIEKMDSIDAIIIDKTGKVHYSSGFREPETDG
ncbi:MAG: FAD:protein FMN transferase [Gammaproteobacteria bacterium]|nr:FAD:protein FMN transferase [Gammaproteobacteria bacterium]